MHAIPHKARESRVCSNAEQQDVAAADETAAKVAFVLEAGLRPDQRSASRFVAERQLRRLTLADFQAACGGARDVSTAAVSGVWATAFQCTTSRPLGSRDSLSCRHARVRSGGIVCKTRPDLRRLAFVSFLWSFKLVCAALQLNNPPCCFKGVMMAREESSLIVDSEASRAARACMHMSNACKLQARMEWQHQQARSRPIVPGCTS